MCLFYTIKYQTSQQIQNILMSFLKEIESKIKYCIQIDTNSLYLK